jgi:hypothetical protein
VYALARSCDSRLGHGARKSTIPFERSQGPASAGRPALRPLSSQRFRRRRWYGVISPSPAGRGGRVITAPAPSSRVRSACGSRHNLLLVARTARVNPRRRGLGQRRRSVPALPFSDVVVLCTTKMPPTLYF